jgi:hypothetical protein
MACCAATPATAMAFNAGYAGRIQTRGGPGIDREYP